MTRLALAILLVAVVAAILAVAGLGLRATLRDTAPPGGSETSPMQKVAFALLVALMLYVAFQGAG